MSSKNLCANCGIPNHIYKNCVHPITSFGVICVRFNIINQCIQPEYLMVQRKDSLSYSTFIRGKYKVDAEKYIIELFQGMTEEERENVLTHDFEILWKQLWKVEHCNTFIKEFEEAKRKFNLLKEGVQHKTRKYKMDLMHFINNTQSNCKEAEWGFPKGKRNINESDINCALREFVEETSISCNHLQQMFDSPIVELFIGGNKLKYKYIYYIYQIFDPEYMKCKSIEPNTLLQQREIQKVEWFVYEDAQNKIKDTNKERKEILEYINKTIMSFPLSYIQKKQIINKLHKEKIT